MNLAGIPPLSGFIGKLGLLEAGVAEGSWPAMVLVGGGVVTSLLTLVAISRVWTRAFWRPPAQAPAADTSRAAAADAGPDTGSAPSPAPGPDGRPDGDDRPADADREPVGVAAPAGGQSSATPAAPGAAAARGRRTRAAARQRAWARHTAVATATTPSQDGFGDAVPGRRPSPARPLPGVMLGATMAMVTVTAALTVVAGPLYGYTDRAAGDLRDRVPYLESVLGQGAAR
jgi:multicomponent Na+:H+ antiporter subunit D